jgi:hypothetical protein
MSQGALNCPFQVQRLADVRDDGASPLVEPTQDLFLDRVQTGQELVPRLDE